MKKVTAYKVDTLANLKPNAIVALKTAGASTFSLYVTDLQGVPHSLNLPATTGVQQIVNTDGALQVVGSTNVVINLEPAILASINSALQVGDNISSLLNDAGYLTSFTESDPIFLASEASNFVVGDKANLDNQSGINTNDETTTTIQTKRPLKTITNKSLEGTGNIGIDKGDVGLGNVDNTSDIDKPISTATQTALDLKLDKVSTAGVERAYIINTDGSQGTKATSEFKDVLEFANLAAFPATGESGKIYVALDTNLQYRWTGSAYVQIGGGGSSEVIDFSQVKGFATDFNSQNIAGVSPMTVVLFGGGSIDYTKSTFNTLEKTHSGILGFKSSATSNSGASISAGGFINNGDNHFNLDVFKIISNSNTKGYVGFHNSTNSGAPAYGCWLEVINGTAVFKTKGSPAPVTSSSSFSLLANTWYNFIIEFKSTTKVYFKIVKDDKSLVAEFTSTTNLPEFDGSGFLTNFNYFSTSAEPVRELVWLDYVEFRNKRPNYLNDF